MTGTQFQRKETEKMINLEVVTIQDCLDLFFMKNKCTICNDGKIIEFIENETQGKNNLKQKGDSKWKG